MKRPYKIRYYDGDYYSWYVSFGPKQLRVAEFWGKHAKHYASTHAKQLNLLPKQERP